MQYFCYMQYFCNVPDADLAHFVDPSLLTRFRKRLGEKGIAIIETEVFELLRLVGIIKGDTLMMDSTVLSSDIVHPNDVMLIHKAFGKMEIFARDYELSLWWDNSHIKKRWRAFGRTKKGERVAYLTEFYALFVPALETFRIHVESLGTATEVPESQMRNLKAQEMLALLNLLSEQTKQKLTGKQHIDNRIVSIASSLWMRLMPVLSRKARHFHPASLAQLFR